MATRLPWTLVCMILCGCASTPPPADHRPAALTTCTTQSLGSLPDSAVEGSLTFSPDIAHIAYVTGPSGHQHIILDGIPGPDFPTIPAGRLSEAGRAQQLRFSPDSHHLAYVATTAEGSVLVVDGQLGAPYDQIGIGKFIFSPDSKHIAAIATRAGKEMVVIDGVEGAPYDSIDSLLPRYTPDGRHFHYIARRGGNYIIILDGREICDRPYASNLTFSPDGNRFAYVARKGEQWVVVLEGVEGPPSKDIGNELIFSADSKHFLYRASDDSGDEHLIVDGRASSYQGAIREAHYTFDPLGMPTCVLLNHEGRFVIHGDQTLGPYADIFGTFAFSPDGKHLAFPIIEKSATAPHGEQRRYIIDGQPQETFDDLEDLQFSSNSEHHAYTAHRRKQHFAIIDGQATPYDVITRLLFSPDGRHIAISAQRGGKNVLTLDGRELPGHDAIYSLIFSPNSSSLAYICHTNGPALNGEEQGGKDSLIQEDKTLIEPCDELRTPQFTPDSRHLITFARRGNQWQIFADSQPTPAFDEFPLPLIIFDSPTQFHTLAIRDTTCFRMQIRIAP